MTKAICATAVLLLLSACGSTTEPAVNNTAPDVPTVNTVSGKNDTDTVANMNDGTRRLSFARAIEAAGLKCDGVIKAVQENGLWRVSCQNGATMFIKVSPDGTFNVTGRSDG